MSRSLLFVAVPPNEAHKHRRSLVDQQVVHGFLNFLLVQGGWGVHIRVVLSSHMRPPPVWTLRLHHMFWISQGSSHILPRHDSRDDSLAQHGSGDDSLAQHVAGDNSLAHHVVICFRSASIGSVLLRPDRVA